MDENKEIMSPEEYHWRLWVDTEFVALKSGYSRRLESYEQEETDTKIYTIQELAEEYKGFLKKQTQ